MNTQNFKFLTFLLLLYNCLDELTVAVACNETESSSNDLDNHFTDEINRIKSLYQNESANFLDKNIELFLTKYDFNNPEKYLKESYSRIYRHMSDYKSKKESLKDVFIFPEEITQENEILFRKGLLDSLIKKEVSMEDIKYNSNYDIYGFPNTKYYENDDPKLVDLQDPRIKMKNFFDISEFITFEPKELLLYDKPICIPTMTLLNLKNTMNENLILRAVKSDLYQVTIFYFRPSKDSNQSYNQKNVYPKTLLPGETMILQIIILPDIIGKIKGNIYLEFNDNKVILFPLIINSVENVYRINPIYSPNWLGSKLLTTPISIYNPHAKTLIVKEVVNSFSSINLVWPNGQPVSSNHTSISSSMLEIPAKTTKNLMMINFYKEVAGVEYGLLQMKTDKDTLIIPVLVRVELQSVKIFPSYYNFGIIDLKQNIKRLIPILITNVGKNPLNIKALYTNMEENLIEFVPNIGLKQCNNGVGFFNSTNEAIGKFNSQSTSTSSPPNSNCLIDTLEEFNPLGFLMIDPTNYTPELNDHQLYKKIQGSFILQTNYSENPFLELQYEYFLDKDTFISIPNEKSYTSTQIDLFYKHLDNQKPSYKYEINIKIKPPLLFNIAGSRIISRVEHERNNDLADIDRLALFPESSQITTRYQESNDSLKLNIILDNPNNFQNKKNYFYPVMTNINMITLIPLKFYDKSLDLYFCDNNVSIKECQLDNPSIFKSVNFRRTVVNISLGTISTSETGVRYFSIANDNNENLMINDVSTNKSNLLLGVECIEDIFTHEKITEKFNFLSNGNLQKVLKMKAMGEYQDKISFAIIANSYTTFSINVNSNVEQDFSGSVMIYFNDSVVLTINLTAKFLKGNLNISPSVIRFEPAFPGSYQNKLVSSKSSYNIPINIHSVKSSDQRIIPILLTNSIISNNRTEILKVIFDPSKVGLEENFMKGEFFMNITSRHLTFKDLYLWKEKQKLWEILGSQGRTEINTIVKIKTNIQNENVNVRAFLTKPSLVKKDEVDFGLIQIGEAVNRYIEVFNPSDETMSIQVLLAPEEYSDIYNNTMFTKNKKFRFTNENQVTLIECYFYNSTSFDNHSSNFTQNFISHSKSKKKKKKSDEEDLGIDIQNSIIIEEDLELHQIKKPEFIKKLFVFAPMQIQSKFVSAERMICNSNFMKKDEIILNNYKELTSKIFSDEFDKDIVIIKKMTESSPPNNHKKEGKENNFGFFEKIAQLLKIFFKTETPKRKKNEIDNRKQEFFLPKIVSSQSYNIKPHQKLKIGPIIFNPSSFSNNSATLFIKNNLTILYPIKLRGNGGSGMLNFSMLERDVQDGSISEIKIDNKLLFEINQETFVSNSEFITKSLKIKNTGNLPVKINNMSIDNSGCEAYGIKIFNCESIYLKPDESFILQISVKPDFNFYFLEKDIIFLTQYNTIVLKLSVNISNELLNQKNRLFNFSYLKNYGYISVFVVVFIISVILYILSKEYGELTAAEYKHNQTVVFMSSKELIENNPVLKFENLFIKAYRKFNQGFYDDFVYKQIDKPGSGSYEMELGEKKKSGGKVTRMGMTHNDEKIEEITNENENVIDIKSIENTGQVLPTIKTAPKKEIPSKSKTTKKPLSKKPIGLGIKSNDKKDEDNLSREPLKLKDANLPNKYDSSSYNYGQVQGQGQTTPHNPINSHGKYGSYEYSGYDANYYHNEPNNLENNSINNHYWSKSYNPYINNGGNVNVAKSQSQSQFNPRYDNNTNPQQGRYNYYNQNTGYNNNFTGNGGTSNNLNYKYQGSIENNLNKSNQNNLNSNTPLPYISGNKLEPNKVDLNFSSTDSKRNKETSNTEKQENISNKELIRPNQWEQNENNSKSVTNLKEQFMAFVPDVFTKEILSQNNNETVADEEPKELHTAESGKKSVENEKPISNKNFTGFNSFTNFDFTDIFKKPNEEIRKESDTEDNQDIQETQKNYQEEDDTSQIYQSERENKIDSGTEELRFNFNSIFNQNQMKFNMDINNFTDNENDNEDAGSKPYFDKNLFFSFDAGFSKSSLVNANPFAAADTKKSLLSELRDDDINYETKDKIVEGHNFNKLDDVVENDDEDEEEDPLWNDENVDIKKEGFFDETGTYKLKQIDFNFDLDFKKRK